MSYKCKNSFILSKFKRGNMRKTKRIEKLYISGEFSVKEDFFIRIIYFYFLLIIKHNLSHLIQCNESFLCEHNL